VKLFPYRRYELVSVKAPREVEAAMRAAVEPLRFLGFGSPSRPFEGEIGDCVFTVQGAISYRNSFLPQIRGKITTAPEGSRIWISMTLHPFVLVFMTIWLGGLGVATVLILSGELRRGGSPSAAFIPAVMFAVGWAIATGAFAFEANIAEPLLATTMTARLSTDAVQP
jgi:hypothetical protein